MQHLRSLRSLGLRPRSRASFQHGTSLLCTFAPLRAHRRSRVGCLFAGHHLSPATLPLVYARPLTFGFAPRYPPCSAICLIGSATLRPIIEEASHSPSVRAALFDCAPLRSARLKRKFAAAGGQSIGIFRPRIHAGSRLPRGRPRSLSACLWGSRFAHCGSK